MKVPLHDAFYTEGLAVFEKWFQERPNDVLDLLLFVRAQSAISRDSGKGSVQQFLLSHNVVVKKNGQLILPEKLAQEDFDADGYTLRKRLRYIPIADLTDGEIATLVLGRKTKKAEETVKKARQKLQIGLTRRLGERADRERAALESFSRRFLHPPSWQPSKGTKQQL